MLYPAAYHETRLVPLPVTGEVVWIFIYLGIFASVAAFICWNWSVSKVGPVKATVFYNLIPLYAAVLSPLFLQEALSWLHVAGGLLIIGGVMLGVWPADRAPDKRRQAQSGSSVAEE